MFAGRLDVWVDWCCFLALCGCAGFAQDGLLVWLLCFCFVGLLRELGFA